VYNIQVAYFWKFAEKQVDYKNLKFRGIWEALCSISSNKNQNETKHPNQPTKQTTNSQISSFSEHLSRIRPHASLNVPLKIHGSCSHCCSRGWSRIITRAQKFEDSLVNIVRPCLRKQRQKTKQTYLLFNRLFYWTWSKDKSHTFFSIVYRALMSDHLVNSHEVYISCILSLG
jgi:hypothetical protein